MTNPLADPYLVLTKIYTDGTLLKQALAETPVEELHRARTVKIVYGVLEKDIYLTHCIRAFAPKAPKPAVRIVLKIALYMMLFMGKARYMVTDNAVALLKRAGKGGMGGFVNALPKRRTHARRRRRVERAVFLSALCRQAAEKPVRRSRGIDYGGGEPRGECTV